MEIPLISLSKSSPKELLNALETTGFIHLALPNDTAVTPADVRGAFALSEYYYSIPETERKRYPRDQDFNGLQALGESALAAERKEGQVNADWKEGFGYGRFEYGSGKSRSDQSLSEEMEGKRNELEAFWRACYELMLQVLDMLSESFELPRDYFRSKHQHAGASGLTLLNYPMPPATIQITDVDIRAGAHKDWGSVTLLFQEENGQPGLEIFIPKAETTKGESIVELMSDVDLLNGTWHAAPIEPNTVLINVGLMLEAWTGGRCRATLHRVVFPPQSQLSSKPRRSIAFFGTPDPDIVLRPITSESREIETTPALTVKEFFAERMRLSTRAGKEY